MKEPYYLIKISKTDYDQTFLDLGSLLVNTKGKKFDLLNSIAELINSAPKTIADNYTICDSCKYLCPYPDEVEELGEGVQLCCDCSTTHYKGVRSLWCEGCAIRFHKRIGNDPRQEFFKRMFSDFMDNFILMALGIPGLRKPEGAREYLLQILQGKFPTEKKEDEQEIISVIDNILDNLRSDGTMDQLKFSIETARSILTGLANALNQPKGDKK